MLLLNTLHTYTCRIQEKQHTQEIVRSNQGEHLKTQFTCFCNFMYLHEFNIQVAQMLIMSVAMTIFFEQILV